MEKKLKYLILGIIAFMIMNIIFVIVFKDESENIFTTISSWINVISTVLMGIISIHYASKIENIKEKRMKKT